MAKAKQPPPPRPPTAAQVRARLRGELRAAGAEMANVCFNLAHGWDLNASTKESACRAAKRWDKALSEALGAKAL